MRDLNWLKIIREKIANYSCEHNLSWQIIDAALTARDEKSKVLPFNSDKIIQENLSELTFQIENKEELFNKIIADLPQQQDVFIKKHLSNNEFPVHESVWNGIEQRLNVLAFDKKIHSQVQHFECAVSESVQENLFAKLNETQNIHFDTAVKEKLSKYHGQTASQTKTQVIEQAAVHIRRRNTNRWIARVAAALVFLFVGDMFYSQLEDYKNNSLNFPQFSDALNQNIRQNAIKNDSEKLASLVSSNEPRETSENRRTQSSIILSKHNTILADNADIHNHSTKDENALVAVEHESNIAVSKIGYSKLHTNLNAEMFIPKEAVAATFIYEPKFNEDLLPSFKAHQNKNKLALGANFAMYYSSMKNDFFKQEFSRGNNVEYRIDANFSYGLNVRYDLNKKIAFNVGINQSKMSQKMYELNNRNAYHTTLNATYLQFPVQFILKNNFDKNSIELSLGGSYANLQQTQTKQNQTEISPSNYIVKQEISAHLGVNYVKGLNNNLKFVSGVHVNVGKDILQKNRTINTAVGANIGVLYYLK